MARSRRSIAGKKIVSLCIDVTLAYAMVQAAREAGVTTGALFSPVIREYLLAKGSPDVRRIAAFGNPPQSQVLYDSEIAGEWQWVASRLNRSP